MSNDERFEHDTEKLHSEVSENTWRNPLALTLAVLALGIVLAIIVMIGAAVFGLDKGKVLQSMGEHEYARGLITYLFAVTTIGTAVALVLAGLLGGSDERFEKRFSRSKEVLSLLLGVFGTIIGFYYGSEVRTHAAAEVSVLSVTPPLLSESTATSGRILQLTAAVRGGRPPYRFSIALGEAKPGEERPVRPDGWIVEQVAAPEVASEATIALKLRVLDSTGASAEGEAKLTVRPK